MANFPVKTTFHSLDDIKKLLIDSMIVGMNSQLGNSESEIKAIERQIISPSTAAQNATIGGEQMKTFRVYFNSKADAPNCWSVDEGTIQTEIRVASVKFLDTTLISRLNLDADNVHEPKAWFEVAGKLSVKDGQAIIVGA